jgi:hypothetical protein
MAEDLGISQGCAKIHYNSWSAIHLTSHKVYLKKTTHIDVLLHFVRYMVESKETMVDKVASEDNLFDVFTSSLPRRLRFKYYLNLINFVEE